MKPVRVQLSRKKGWRMPKNTVKVTRPGMWGNPFTIETCGSRERAVAAHRRMMKRLDKSDSSIGNNFRMHLEDLRGKNLACWCKLSESCHADILLKLANRRGTLLPTPHSKP